MSISSKLRHQYFLYIAFALIVAVWVIGMAASKTLARTQSNHIGLTLLIPQASSLEHPVTQAWLATAKEAGILLNAMTDDEFVRARANKIPMAGVVLPDSVHQQASDLLITHLYQYVNEGGDLLVSFDAATLQHGRATYSKESSRLSELVGVKYALYNTLGDATTVQGVVYANRDAEKKLAIQPGKLDFGVKDRDPWGALTTYAYEALNYSYYKTMGTGRTEALLKSGQQDAIVARSNYGGGTVLFANLPLGYLKTRTDGYLLHKLLTYFATNVAKQPQLAATPDAIGGVILSSEQQLEATGQHKTMKGARAYYTTADSGLGPTHSYAFGEPAQGKDIWAFPISHFKQSASLNEISEQGVSQADIHNFIATFLKHVSDNHIARTLHFNPGPQVQDSQAMDSLTIEASKLQDIGRFRWYRMNDLAEFMTLRERTRWQVTQSTLESSKQLNAYNESSLISQTWIFDKASTQALKLLEGKAQIKEVGDKWMVTAGDCRSLVIEWQETGKS